MEWLISSSWQAPASRALFGQLPGVEPRPYILRFTEDKPNPLYRRICYTFAWSDVITFASLNLAGLAIAAITGVWYLKQIYALRDIFLFISLSWPSARPGYFPRARAHPTPGGEGTERRYFYGSVWAVTLAQAMLMLLWKLLPKTHAADLVKLAAYVVALALIGFAARAGLLPRTRPILPGEFMVAD